MLNNLTISYPSAKEQIYSLKDEVIPLILLTWNHGAVNRHTVTPATGHMHIITPAAGR